MSETPSLAHVSQGQSQVNRRREAWGLWRRLTLAQCSLLCPKHFLSTLISLFILSSKQLVREVSSLPRRGRRRGVRRCGHAARAECVNVSGLTGVSWEPEPRAPDSRSSVHEMVRWPRFPVVAKKFMSKPIYAFFSNSVFLLKRKHVEFEL